MKRKDVLLILVPTFIFVLFWMVFSIYHSYINSTISAVTNTQINPITPSFDTKIIDEIKTRENVNPSFAAEVAISPTPTNSQEASISASPTPILNPTAVSTSSGNQNISSSGGTLSQ